MRIPALEYYEWQKGVIAIQDNPPESPSAGDSYIIGEGTGVWEGKDDNIAIYTVSGWTFIAPRKGMFCFVKDKNKLYHYINSWEIYDDKTTQILIVVDEKPNGTHGGTFTGGAWRTRDLNTIRYNTISGASLSSNQIELPAGTYIVSASAPHKQVEKNKIKIRNITASSDLVIGQNSKMSESDKDTSPAILCGKFTLSSTSKIELQHRCNTSKTDTGFGFACGFGVVEVYSQVYIEKIG